MSSPQPDGSSATTFVHVAAGATLSLAGADTAGTANVSFQITGEQNSSRLQINLTEVSSGTAYTSYSGDGFALRRRPHSDASDGGESLRSERTLAVPTGRYQITLAGDPELYLDVDCA